jgi:hypothetical protein
MINLRKGGKLVDDESIYEQITTSFKNAFPNFFSGMEKSTEDQVKSIKRKLQSGI